jgi:hypothetical protein
MNNSTHSEAAPAGLLQRDIIDGQDVPRAEKRATHGDKVICFLFPIAWLVVASSGRKGAGAFALAGLAVGLLVRTLG